MSSLRDMSKGMVSISQRGLEPWGSDTVGEHYFTPLTYSNRTKVLRGVYVRLPFSTGSIQVPLRDEKWDHVTQNPFLTRTTSLLNPGITPKWLFVLHRPETSRTCGETHLCHNSGFNSSPRDTTGYDAFPSTSGVVQRPEESKLNLKIRSIVVDALKPTRLTESNRGRISTLRPDSPVHPLNGSSKPVVLRLESRLVPWQS